MNVLQNPDGAPSTTEFVQTKVAAQTRLEKIRSELNIEKWPAIWQPAKSKNKLAVRTMQRETLSDDGARVVSQVEIGFTQLGTLTTEEQKLLYVLIKLWEDADKPDVQVFFSTRGLARLLKKKGWGSNVIESITKSLRKLRTIPIEWVNSYFDKTTTGSVVVDRRPFTILGDLRIVERRQDGAINSSLGYFKFNDHILSNLQLNYTKPVCIEEFFKLKSEIAQLVYTHIDLILFDKTKYERKSRELFNDLGLKNQEYNHMYERKRALERALTELQGIRLSSGVLRSASIEKTVDGKDYKVVFQKTKRADGISEFEASQNEAPRIIINHYLKQKDELVIQAEKLVRHFHKTFYGVNEHTPQSKETGQAVTLVTQSGFEAAKQIIDFAHGEALKTKFSVQHFGAILSYTSRALADFEEENKKKSLPALAAVEPPTAAEARLERGEARLAVLTVEQYALRSVRVREEVLKQNPAMVRFVRKEESGIVDKIVRSRIVRELESEPMEFLVISSMPEWIGILTI